MPRLVLALLLLLPLAAAAADKTTQHSIALPTGPLAFSAAVETIRLNNPQGAPQLEIVTTAFLLNTPQQPPATQPPAPRPVAFIFNGGPGAASAFLNLGAIGPWRVPLQIPVIPSQDPSLADNAETWLPFTDLVFIDPPETGFSRVTATGDNPARPFLCQSASKTDPRSASKIDPPLWDARGR